jgi:hypothetical protein
MLRWIVETLLGVCPRNIAVVRHHGLCKFYQQIARQSQPLRGSVGWKTLGNAVFAHLHASSSSRRCRSVPRAKCDTIVRDLDRICIAGTVSGVRDKRQCDPACRSNEPIWPGIRQSSECAQCQGELDDRLQENNCATIRGATSVPDRVGHDRRRLRVLNWRC